MSTEPLLPAEAALLVEPKASAAAKCLQAALLTLVSRDHLATEEEGRLLKTRYLRLKPGDGAQLPRHLATVKNALEVYAIAGRLNAGQAARALQKSFGMGYGKYVHDVLAPPLIARGLLELHHRRFLGLIPYRHYQRTLAGEARVERLVRLLDEAGGLKKLIKTDPDRAIGIGQAAGIMLVMSPAAKAQIPKLKAMLAERAGDGGSGAYYGDSSDDESGWEIGFDLGDFSLTADVDGWFDSIGSIGDFTGGDGGGDGGDGGGGD